MERKDDLTSLSYSSGVGVVLVYHSPRQCWSFKRKRECIGNTATNERFAEQRVGEDEFDRRWGDMRRGESELGK